MKSNENIIAEHLGDVYYRHQLPGKAKKMYERAMELESDEGNAKKIQSKISAIEQKTSPVQDRIPASDIDSDSMSNNANH
jgi:uncharacterized protein HemY